MKLTWYGHACFKLDSSDGAVVFDPYERGKVPGSELPALEADMVISSHKHSDHYAPSMVSISTQTPGFDVERIACFHDEAGGTKRGRNYITVIESEGLRVAHMGDIGHQLSKKQLEKLGKIDIMLLPVGGTYTLNADEAAELVKSAQPRAVVPMHYLRNGIGFDVLGSLEDFTKHFDAVEMLGSTWEIDALPEGVSVFFFDKPVQN